MTTHAAMVFSGLLLASASRNAQGSVPHVGVPHVGGPQTPTTSTTRSPVNRPTQQHISRGHDAARTTHSSAPGTSPTTRPPARRSTTARAKTPSRATSRRPAAPAPTLSAIDRLMRTGHEAYAAGHVREAVDAYRAAAHVDSSRYEVLWQLAYGLADLGDTTTNRDTQRELYADAEHWARRAMVIDSAQGSPGAPDARFTLARILAQRDRLRDIRTRLATAREIHDLATTALQADPNHVGALHVLGVWHAEVCRLNTLQRQIAMRLLGGSVLRTASREAAMTSLSRAAALDPDRIVHHLELGRLWLDRGDVMKARTSLDRAIALPPRDINDPAYLEQARALRARLPAP